jgi:hypothetical protein
MNKKKIYLRPKRHHRRLLGPLCSSSYGAVSTTCTFHSSVLIVPVRCRRHHFCHVVSLAVVIFASPSLVPAPLLLSSDVTLFLVVLIHHPPHKQVLVAVESLWVCRLGARRLEVNNIDET